MPIKTTKSRSNPVYMGTGTLWESVAEGKPVINPPESADNYLPAALKETQVTVSENHPGWRHRNKRRFTGDIGGDFTSTRVKVDRVINYSYRRSDKISRTGGKIYIHKYGPTYPCSGGTMFVPTVSGSSDTALNAWGAQAIAAVKPTNSVADVSEMLGEVLREGIPKLIGSSLWKDKAREGRKMASDEYLNYQFGWKPIANEIASVASAIATADAVIRQYQRDSGKIVRRRYDFPPQYSVTFPAISQPLRASDYLPSSSAIWDGPTGQGTLVRKFEQLTRRWFSGAFTYYLPSGGIYSKMASQALYAKKILGLTLTPNVVWNLAPWSWAVDWFTNAGDVISNLSDWSADGLCLRYGYIMEHTLARNTYSYFGGTGLKGGGYPASIVVTKEVKQRRKANPFGFGLTWNGLTTTQLSILAALGINRGT